MSEPGHALAHAALAAYDLPAGVELTPIRFVNNAVFAVGTSEEHYVLRVHRPDYRDPAHVRSELAFLTFLDERLEGTGVRVPRPVATRTGDLFVDVDGRQCTLL